MENKDYRKAYIHFNERKQNLNQQDSAKMLAINLQALNQIFTWASEQWTNDIDKKQGTNQKTIVGEMKKWYKENERRCINNTSREFDTVPQIQFVHYNKQLVCLASVAGMLDYPQSSLYAKCKRAMIATSQAYRTALQPFDIGVTCIASGYVDTEQLRQLNNGNAQHKPFIISETQAVAEIRHAIHHNLALHCFPKPMKAIVQLLNSLPTPLLNTFMSWQYRKQDRQ